MYAFVLLKYSDMNGRLSPCRPLQDLDALPTSQTCFFQIRLPEYTSQQALADKLRYAIKHCRSIDMDNYMLRRGPDEYEEYESDDEW